jgi:hypothetical protein
MMATTIIISTRVKPALREVLFVFMLLLSFHLRRERRSRLVAMIITIFVHLLPATTAAIQTFSISSAKVQRKNPLRFCRSQHPV